MAESERTRKLARLRRYFKQKYRIDDTSGCWVWTAAKQQGGYGYIGTCGLWKNSKPAHVVSLLLHRDDSLDLDDKITVHHKCFNVSCVNPSHLVVMSTYEQALHHEHTALGVLDKMELEFPEAAAEVTALRDKIKTLLGLTRVVCEKVQDSSNQTLPHPVETILVSGSL